MPRVIVCDVNETLLDPRWRVGAALQTDIRRRPRVAGLVCERPAYSEVARLAGPYSDFASIGGASLDMVASARGITLPSADRSRILQGMLTLPAHPDVRDAFRRCEMQGCDSSR
jgi:2-haloacid dehalogenase